MAQRVRVYGSHVARAQGSNTTRTRPGSNPYGVAFIAPARAYMEAIASRSVPVRKVLWPQRDALRALGARELVSFLYFFMNFIHPDRAGEDPRACARESVRRNAGRAAGFRPPPV